MGIKSVFLLSKLLLCIYLWGLAVLLSHLSALQPANQIAGKCHMIGNSGHLPQEQSKPVTTEQRNVCECDRISWTFSLLHIT